MPDTLNVGEDDKKKVVLTDEQKKFIDENWTKLKRVDLVRQTFNDPTLDARHKKGKAILEYLGERQPIPTEYQKMDSLELSVDQQEFVRNNAKTNTATEMSRTIFNNHRLSTLHQETRAVIAYMKTLPTEITGKTFDDEVADEYRAPSTVKQVIQRVNDCVFTNFDEAIINKNQRHTFEIIRSFLRSPRFLQMMNSYTSKVSRKIFEEEFIRTIYNKPDLTHDELNLCINLCSNYVLMITVNRQLDMLNERYEIVVSNPEASMSIALAEMIKAKTKELNDCDARQQRLINDLEGSRGKRQLSRTNSDLTVAKLIEWWSSEEERKKALERADKRKEEVEGDVARIIDMEDIQARILGFTKSELING